MKKFLLLLLVICSVTIGFCSCKAWRTITTTATYVQSNDSTKTTTSISSKTIEEYQGSKRK